VPLTFGLITIFSFGGPESPIFFFFIEDPAPAAVAVCITTNVSGVNSMTEPNDEHSPFHADQAVQRSSSYGGPRAASRLQAGQFVAGLIHEGPEPYLEPFRQQQQQLHWPA
jgi:hypothetical protein